jgi:hypothetical protein
MIGSVRDPSYRNMENRTEIGKTEIGEARWIVIEVSVVGCLHYSIL